MPAGKTYVKIASQTLSGASANVTFSNLPQNYTDLVLIMNGQSTQATTYDNLIIQFNGDTGSNYSRTRLNGFSGGAVSERSTNATSHLIGPITGTSFSSSIFSSSITHIQNYSNSSTNKTAIYRSNSNDGYVQAGASLWRNTNAITSITIQTLSGSNLAANCTFTIYGIEAAKSPYAEGGDKVYSTGTHWVHEFYNSGTFVPRQNLTCDYLVVAGGAGGGGGANVTNTRSGGGGGAGGMRCTVTATGGGGSVESALSLSAQAYTVIVGAGGAAGINTSSAGTAGSNSVFSSITSTGGGSGGLANSDTATTGGSGGGGGTAYNGKAGTSNQGYAGGNGTASSNAAGGGGGAGAAGANGTSGQGGNGGNGVATSISGSSITYGGGGGGAGGALGSSTAGTGGAGGGGAGGYHHPSTSSGLNATSGTVNRGGGGGGGSVDTYSGTPGSGGSGIVIVRYSI